MNDTTTYMCKSIQSSHLLLTYHQCRQWLIVATTDITYCHLKQKWKNKKTKKSRSIVILSANDGKRKSPKKGIIHGCCCQCQKSYDRTNNCVTRRKRKRRRRSKEGRDHPLGFWDLMEAPSCPIFVMRRIGRNSCNPSLQNLPDHTNTITTGMINWWLMLLPLPPRWHHQRLVFDHASRCQFFRKMIDR